MYLLSTSFTRYNLASNNRTIKSIDTMDVYKSKSVHERFARDEEEEAVREHRKALSPS